MVNAFIFSLLVVSINVYGMGCIEGDEAEHTPLVNAIARLNHQKVRGMINSGMNSGRYSNGEPCNNNQSLNHCFYFGSLLHLVELFADVQMAEILLMSGVSRDIVNEFGKKPLDITKLWIQQDHFQQSRFDTDVQQKFALVALLEEFQGPSLPYDQRFVVSDINAGESSATQNPNSE